MSRLCIPTVTIFLICRDQYLFLRRSPTKTIDPDVYNGVGGRVEPRESPLEAAVREVEEETGYVITPTQMRYAGHLSLTGGYPSDWEVDFYTAEVGSTQIPRGTVTDDGSYHWMTYEEFVSGDYPRCDDLTYIFGDIHSGTTFAGSGVYNDQLKIVEYTSTL